MSDTFDQDKIETRPTFEQALEELKRDHANLPGPTVLYGLSGMTDDQLQQLDPVWSAMDTTYRRVLMQMLVDAAESDFELDYRALGYANLEAAEPEIRQAAIELVVYDRGQQAIERLVHIALNDQAAAVRAEAVRSLGAFVLDAELGHQSRSTGERLQAVLMTIIGNSAEDTDVRRFAIEALANCTRDDLPAIIRTAYDSGDDRLRLSAVVAMGNSCDNRWDDIIIEELENRDELIRREAIRAAGSLTIAEAVDAIIEIMGEGEREDQEVGIYALGEIGGKQATRILETLLEGAEEAGDDALIEILDEAIANASLANGDFMMLDFDEDDLEL